MNRLTIGYSPNLALHRWTMKWNYLIGLYICWWRPSAADRGKGMSANCTEGPIFFRLMRLGGAISWCQLAVTSETALLVTTCMCRASTSSNKSPDLWSLRDQNIGLRLKVAS